jgi:hypothetical protein
MAIASILVGVVSGIAGFVAALVLGKGLVIALAVYAMAGALGMLATLAIGFAAGLQSQRQGLELASVQG